MPTRFVCIHAHLYQPPRENPWIEEVEKEPSAHPFHDWNSRITDECYAANCHARILKNEKIYEITNNYEKISFNFGPTLLSWMQKHKPEVYETIIESDKKSVKERNGHGNAIAQVYNHSIMPLNGPKDKETQILWGIKDFELRFGRKPEGIWFAESAVDSESLAIAARNGIRFSILAPGQAKRVRPIGAETDWENVNNGVGGPLDTSKPYLFRPDKDSEITLFFYDGALAHSIAFNGALYDGVGLGKSFIEKAMKDYRPGALVHIATDGESYGHHHRFGEMALAAAVKEIESQKDVRLTNYGEYLESHIPSMEVDIYQDSSWSCAHGVERWKSDCGCSCGGVPDWNQKWRAPLRKAFTELKNDLDAIFEDKAAKYCGSPWEARNEYVELLIQRDDETVKRWMSKHTRSPLNGDQTIEVLKLMEMQNNAMKMFTSCGWFFADISGLESVQIMKYAAKAIDLAGSFSNINLEEKLLKNLKKAVSNASKKSTGAEIYLKEVKPLISYPMRVRARTAILNHFGLEGDISSVFSRKIEITEKTREEYHETAITVGKIKSSLFTTKECFESVFCLHHLGGHEFNCAIIPFDNPENFEDVRGKLLEAFSSHAPDKINQAIKSNMPGYFFSFEALFEGERQAVMEKLTSQLLSQVGHAYDELFEKHYKLIEFFLKIDVPTPEEFKPVAKYVFEKRINSLFAEKVKGNEHEIITATLAQADRWNIRLGLETLKNNLSAFLENRLNNLDPENELDPASPMLDAVDLLKKHGIKSDFREVENEIYPFYVAYKDPSHKMHKAINRHKGFIELFRLFNFYV